jgi:hypothetical protein
MVVHDWYKEYHCSWLRSSQIANCVENSSTGPGKPKIRNHESPCVRPIKTMQNPDDAVHRVAHYEGEEEALGNQVHRSFIAPTF